MPRACPVHAPQAAELHTVLTLLSTGPMGLSDAIDLSDVELLKRTIRSDGKILGPSKARFWLPGIASVGFWLPGALQGWIPASWDVQA